ncbi:hypothetical protein ABPG77_004135 [Micractinium sp. CCAP 211/92]
MKQLVACLARSGLLSEAVTSLRSELRPAAVTAWHLQRRSAAAAAGDEQPPAAQTPAAEPQQAAAAAAASSAEPVAQGAAAAGKKPQQGARAKPPQQAARGKPRSQQQQPVQQPEQQQGAKPKPKPKQSAKQQSTMHSMLAGVPVGSLPEAPLNRYFDVPTGILPEATAEYYQDPVLKGENVHEPNYGCKAVQREWEWSGRRSLLTRACMQDLVAAVQGKERSHLYLDGWAGSGKSVALYSLVAWARANGWLALYMPSAFSLVQTGTFYKGEDGLWDTPEAARWLLSSLRDSHAEQLAPLKTPSGQPLSELLEEGLSPATKPAAAVAAAVAAKDALAAQTQLPFLLAVDDYNVLYSHTGYYESVHSFHRRQLAPDELRLVRAFRVLEQPGPALGAVVAAPTFGQTVSDRLRLPKPAGARFTVPRYSFEEAGAAATYFLQEVLKAGGTCPEDALRRALFLTNGNAAELRRFMPGLLGLGGDVDLLGLSRGYKAEAARRKKHDQGLVA